MSTAARWSAVGGLPGQEGAGGGRQHGVPSGQPPARSLVLFQGALLYTSSVLEKIRFA